MNIDSFEMLLMWCTILNGAVLLFSSGICLCFRFTDGISRFYCRLYNLPQDTLRSIGVLFIGIYKMVWITFNLVPYLALLLMKHL